MKLNNNSNSFDNLKRERRTLFNGQLNFLEFTFLGSQIWSACTHKGTIDSNQVVGASPIVWLYLSVSNRLGRDFNRPHGGQQQQRNLCFRLEKTNIQLVEISNESWNDLGWSKIGHLPWESIDFRRETFWGIFDEHKMIRDCVFFGGEF